MKGKIRHQKLIVGKDGHGSDTFKISLPTDWIKKINMNKNEIFSIIELEDNKITIKKEIKKMLLIEDEHGKWVNSFYDYRLENGILLFEQDWNGEIYMEALDSKTEKIIKKSYKPVYRFEDENIDLSTLEENSEQWIRACEIIGFEEL